jgi:hypothetical protein
MGLPQYFCLSIALTENAALDPYAVNVNSNGTVDRGVFQLSSSWYKEERWHEPEINCRDGIALLKKIMAMERVDFTPIGAHG